jgi:hypothetical protein
MVEPLLELPTGLELVATYIPGFHQQWKVWGLQGVKSLRPLSLKPIGLPSLLNYFKPHKPKTTLNSKITQVLDYTLCRNPTLTKCEGEAQHLEKVRIWSLPGLSNV